MDAIDEELAIAEERSSEPPAIRPDMLEEPIATLCTRPAISIGAAATAREAVQAMQEHRIGSVLVVEGERLIGIVTERDILMKVAAKDGAISRPVTTIMTRDPETLRSGDSLVYLMNKMHVGGFRHVPIVDDTGTPLHVVSLRDVLRYMLEQFGSLVRNIPSEPYRGEVSEHGA